MIPTYNVAAFLDAQLTSLHAQCFGKSWEIVVADNRSTDGTRDLVDDWASRFGRVRLVDASERRGANYARNIGAASAHGRCLLFCDADDVVGDTWLCAMAAAAERYRIFGGPYEDRRLNREPFVSWRAPHSQDKFPRGELQFLPYALGGNLGIDSDLFHEIGGFNEAFVYGGAEVDLSWRAQLQGAELVFVPDAIVHVRLRSSLRALAHQSYARGTGVAHLASSYRDHPILKPRPADAIRTWGWIIYQIPSFIRAPRRNGHWVRIVFNRLGRLRGSLRHRILCA